MCEPNHVVMGVAMLSFATMFGACRVFVTGRMCIMTVTLITTNHTDTSMYRDSRFCRASSWVWIVKSGYSELKPQFYDEHSALVGVT